MSVILTRPTGNASTSGGGQISSVVVGPSATEIIDAVDANLYRTMKWIVTLINNITDETRSYEILATHRAGTNPTYTLYAKIGDNVAHTEDVVITGTDLELKITNNEAVDITVDAVRISTIA